MVVLTSEFLFEQKRIEFYRIYVILTIFKLYKINNQFNKYEIVKNKIIIMKKLIILFSLAIYTLSAMAQEADKITGVWWNEEKTSKIEIEKKDGKFIGTIVYVIPENYENGEPPKDDENPDESLRNRSILGLQILEGLDYNSKKEEWENGEIYDPKSGNTYDCYAWLENDDLLKLKGFVGGIRWLGRSSEWYRTEL